LVKNTVLGSSSGISRVALAFLLVIALIVISGVAAYSLSVNNSLPKLFGNNLSGYPIHCVETDYTVLGIYTVANSTVRTEAPTSVTESTVTSYSSSTPVRQSANYSTATTIVPTVTGTYAEPIAFTTIRTCTY
jgi:hypothetical protein